MYIIYRYTVYAMLCCELHVMLPQYKLIKLTIYNHTKIF